MKQLYICRGVVGSGKSTYARTVAPLVVEPDIFRYNEDNKYVFDSEKNQEVHDKAKDLCEYAMRHLRMPALAVTATLTKFEHVLPYIRLGKKHGYDVTVVECSGAFQNIHEVPEAVIRKMHEEFEPFDAELANQEGVHLRFLKDGVPEDVR